MNTKIVYVIVANKEKIYVEQAYMSIWSCKHFNKDVRVEVVCDEESIDSITGYEELNTLIDSIKSFKFEEKITKFERSRILKTSLRNLIQGDFLFVDTDTIFCDSIQEVDDFNFDIGMVEDGNLKSFKNHPFKEAVNLRLEKTFNLELTDELPYYNSGVIYCKDTDKAKEFYKKWHDNWLISKSVGYKGMFDQQSLCKTILENPGYVNSINGIYNAQISENINYLTPGKILHFFNTKVIGRHPVHPFLNNDYYKQIQRENRLSDNVKEDIINCKTIFYEPSVLVAGADIPFFKSNTFIIFNLLLNNKVTNYLLNRIKKFKN